jgi:hypothetical protein
MASIAQSIIDYFSHDREVSKHAKNVQNIFSDQNIGQPFFDLVYKWFGTYDQHNRDHPNKHLYTDVKFITKCAMQSLTISEDSHLISQRVDAYFYMLRRIIEYIDLQHGSINEANYFRKMLLGHLTDEFKSSKGKSPNLCINDKEVIKRIDIKQHLTSLIDISSTPTLIELFVLCKLAIQSSQIAGGPNSLCWKDVLKTVKQWRISLQDFVGQYTQHKESFAQFPLDASAFVYLIRVIYPSKTSQPVSFETFRNMLCNLNLDYRVFFLEYRDLFGENVKQTFYEYQYISSLLVVVFSSVVDLFGIYLQIYASNTSFDTLWGMLLYFSQKHELNVKMEEHLIPILTKQTEKMSMATFKHCCQMAKNSVQMMKKNHLAGISRILQEMFHAFLRKEIYRAQYCHPLLESDAKEFLSTLLSLSWPADNRNSSCLFVIEHLIFILYDHAKDKFEKLKRLFKRLNETNEEICVKNKPEKFIQDQWLNDYVCDTPYDWLKLNRADYQSLCEIHQNNRWSLYIWSKLTCLSVSIVDMKYSHEILEKLNKWIAEVQHDKYHDNDQLTTIFVNSIFECIILKHSKSPLSLPNIQPMIRYILDARAAKSRWINILKVDEFVEIVQQSIRAVLLLEGESICFLLCSICSIIASSCH